MTLKADISESISLRKKLLLESKKINDFIEKIYSVIANNKKILICGNGGSAADAEHLSTEYIVRLKKKNNRAPLKFFSLTFNMATITATANDYSYNQIFSRNLESIGEEGDLLIVLSTSGNSKNILSVLKKAKKKKIDTMGWLGSGGGLAKKFCENKIIIKSNSTARIQEEHKFLGHYIFDIVEQKLIKNGKIKII